MKSGIAQLFQPMMLAVAVAAGVIYMMMTHDPAAGPAGAAILLGATRRRPKKTARTSGKGGRSRARRTRAEEPTTRFGRILERSVNEIYVFHAGDLRFVQVNEGARRNLGYTMDELKEMTPLDLKPEYDKATFEQLLAPLLRGAQDTITFETVHRRKDGSLYPVEVRLHLSRAERQPLFVAIILDITERRRAESQMRKLSGALQQTADAIAITDHNGVVEYVNPAFEAATGYSMDEIVGRAMNITRSGKQEKDEHERLWRTLRGGRVFRDVIVNRRKNGELYYEEKTITPLRDKQGNIGHFVATGRDITERVQTQERLRRLAHHDVLTDLPNRAFFIERLNHALARACARGRSLAVLFLDLGRFKIINDTLGHDGGDRALQILADRLRSCVHDGDLVARLGGDEFTILLDDVASVDDIPQIARRVLDTLAQPFTLRDREFYISSSIGVSLYPGDGEDALTLLKNADTAMYRAKELGRNNYQFYSAEMSARALERLTMEANLRRALERGEFLLHYQPQIDLATGRIARLEALLRWAHPELGPVAPARFIPVAEETGLIAPIGRWVLQTACDQARAWRAAGLPAVPVAVNLSGTQFNEPRLVQMIDDILRDTGLEPSGLELEITENTIMHNVQEAVDTMRVLNDRGISLAVDDFGTGYSSLNYLKRFPIDTLKIDQSFVRDITHDADDASIVTAIIAMAHNIELKVVAEGVETEDQLAFLRARGCDGVQGYLFARPLPTAETGQLLRAGASLGGVRLN